MNDKRALKAFQNSVWAVPKPFKIEAWDGPGSRNAAVKLHRAAKRQPRASKKAQETPKKCPREASSRPRANKSRSSDGPENTKPFQNPPQDAIGAQSLQEALLDRLRKRFCVVLWLEDKARNM